MRAYSSHTFSVSSLVNNAFTNQQNILKKRPNHPVVSYVTHISGFKSLGKKDSWNYFMLNSTPNWFSVSKTIQLRLWAKTQQLSTAVFDAALIFDLWVFTGHKLTLMKQKRIYFSNCLFVSGPQNAERGIAESFWRIKQKYYYTYILKTVLRMIF